MICSMSPTRVALTALVALCVLGGCKRKGGGTDGGQAAPPPIKDGAQGYRLTPGLTGAMDGTLQAPLRKRWIAQLDAEVSYPIVTRTSVFVIEATVPFKLVGFDLDTSERLWDPLIIDQSDAMTA